jgi:hypothetical protein
MGRAAFLSRDFAATSLLKIRWPSHFQRIALVIGRVGNAL